MPKIQKLPESLIRLIAAGEVIERPASVLKELVENSLDAGATQLSIDIWGAGRTRLRVSDNGEGMTPEDAELALDRHATSKLHAFEDLEKLATFGFRGEALPSIAAVSRLELTTRIAGAPQAWRMKLEGGKLLSSQAVGAPVGTTIDVQDLFFNTPARSKFMKKDSTERSHLLRTLQEIALAHPNAGFQVSAEGKNIFTLAPAHDLPAGQAGLRERISDIWGSSVTEGLVPLEILQGPIRIHGLVNRLPSHQPTKNYQHLFVNGRPVQQRMLTHAIYEAYHEWLPVGRHPAYVLFIQISPILIDVNVHPTKREVRFSNERATYDLLFTHIRRVLEERQDVPVMAGRLGSGLALRHFEKSTVGDVVMQDLTPDVSQQQELVSDAPLRTLSKAPLRILGNFQRLYILAEQENQLLIIDQHAAAERVLYEKLLQQAKLNQPATQPLLTPYIWELPADQAEQVSEALPSLKALGFGLEPFGGNSFALKEWPAVFPQLRQAKQFLDVFIEALEEESHDSEEHAHHEKVASAACRAAIKANDYVAPEEMFHLLQELAACQRPMTCPHGRPTHIRLPLSELNRRFNRT